MTDRGVLAKSMVVLAVVAVTIGILSLPDFVAGPMRGRWATLFDAESWVSISVIAAGLALTFSLFARRVAIALILASQVIWLGYYRVFGSVLLPDEMQLFFSEMHDAGGGALAEWRQILPSLLISLVSAALLFVLHGRRESLIPRMRGAGLVLLVVLSVASVRWAAWKELVISFPGENSWSAIGLYRVGVSAMRLAIVPPPGRPAGVAAANPVINKLPHTEEPVTVLVILGESINPRHLSLLGYGRTTTPHLDSWRRRAPGGMSMTAGFGFSGGVATLASVPSFVKTSAVPIGPAPKGVNLFELARASGFKSWFLSAQARHFLNTAGGAPGATVATVDDNWNRYHLMHDDYLIEMLGKAASDTAQKKFVIVHQRVNHIPYDSNCSHVPSMVNFEPLSDDESAMRIAHYDTGLACWDRSVDALVQKVAERPGAVYVFITADHNELMGEGGLWAHLHPVLENGLVPFILLTNRPNSEAAQLFANMPLRTHFHFTRAVARALDTDLSDADAGTQRFFLNRTLPFGVAGYIEAKPQSRWRFNVTVYDKMGHTESVKDVNFNDVSAWEARQQINSNGLARMN